MKTYWESFIYKYGKNYDLTKDINATLEAFWNYCNNYKHNVEDLLSIAKKGSLNE